jgi:hypothetical protein
MAMKTSKGGAGMIGGVRSPMARSGHGIVSQKPKVAMYSHGIDNATTRKQLGGPDVINSPQKAKDNV